MKSGSESKDSKKSLRASNIRITPVGESTIGVMSDGSGLLELGRTTVDDSPITTTKTYEIVQEFELIKIFYPSWSPDSSKYRVQVDTVTHGPAERRTSYLVVVLERLYPLASSRLPREYAHYYSSAS